MDSICLRCAEGGENLKVWELRQQLDDLGDDVEVSVLTDDGEYEIAEVKPIPAAGTATIVLGELQE